MTCSLVKVLERDGFLRRWRVTYRYLPLLIVAYRYLSLLTVAYRQRYWNVMDFFVVVFGVIDLVPSSGVGGGAISSFRLFRVLRVLRTVNRFPELKALVQVCVSWLVCGCLRLRLRLCLCLSVSVSVSVCVYGL